MKNLSFQSTDLVCLECGNVYSIMRKSRALKEVSHIKDLWCYKCKKDVKHYEVRDIEKFIATDSLDEVKLYVKDIVRNGKEDNIDRRNRIFRKVLKKLESR